MQTLITKRGTHYCLPTKKAAAIEAKCRSLTADSHALQATASERASFQKPLVEGYGQSISGRLREGDMVVRTPTSNLFYGIDSAALSALKGMAQAKQEMSEPDFFKFFFERHPRAEEEGRVHALFAKEGVRGNGRIVVPFSAVIRNGVSSCLEYSILYQIVADSDDVMLVGGTLRHDNADDTTSYISHAFNIELNSQSARILDVSVRWDGEAMPYISPILAVGPALGELRIPEENWQYSTHFLGFRLYVFLRMAYEQACSLVRMFGELEALAAMAIAGGEDMASRLLQLESLKAETAWLFE